MADEHRRRVVEPLRDALCATREDLARLATRAASFLEGAASRTPGDLEVYGAGALLHGYYNVLERWMERVARDMNAAPPTGADWHRLLLRSMALDKPGLRPPLLDGETAAELARYLGFRHMFRHLYVLDLRWDEIRLLLSGLAPLHAKVDRDLARFEAFLASLCEL